MTEKNRVNSFSRRHNAGSRATFSTRSGPNSRRRRSASDDDSPLGLLRTLAIASSIKSWWIFIASFSFHGRSSYFGLPNRLLDMGRNAPPGRFLPWLRPRRLPLIFVREAYCHDELAAFGVFAIGYLVRPIGGATFAPGCCCIQAQPLCHQQNSCAIHISNSVQGGTRKCQ